MYCVRKVTDDLYWVGANDHRLHLFENIHPIPQGVSYNAYLLLDEKSVLFDTVDWSACRQLLENLSYLLGGETPGLPGDQTTWSPTTAPALRRCCSASPLSNWWATPRPSPLWGEFYDFPLGRAHRHRQGRGVPSPWAGIPSNSI